MIKTYKYGFEYKGLLYGWSSNGKELFRLPCTKNKRTYSFKKLNLIKVGNKEGYRVCADKKTKQQLDDITTVINHKQFINSKGSDDCPF